MLDREFLVDLFVDFGAITIRRLFSGYGISVEGVTFALLLRDGLYFRADQDSIACFKAEGMTPFIYQNRLRTVTMNSYWQVPARLFDDSEELAQWARRALASARTAAAKKRVRRPQPGTAGAKDAGNKDRGKTAAGKATAKKTAPKKAAEKKTAPGTTAPGRKASKKTVPGKTAAGKTATGGRSKVQGSNAAGARGRLTRNRRRP